MKWLREVNANSRSIHLSVKSWGVRNRILALHVGATWVEDVPDIRLEAVCFFRDHFSVEE